MMIMKGEIDDFGQKRDAGNCIFIQAIQSVVNPKSFIKKMLLYPLRPYYRACKSCAKCLLRINRDYKIHLTAPPSLRPSNVD